MLRAIGDARNNTEFFGGRTPDEADGYSSIDLIHFLTLLSDISDNSEVDQAAQGLIDATSSMIVYHQASESMSAAHGMAVYFPSNESVLRGIRGQLPGGSLVHGATGRAS